VDLLLELLTVESHFRIALDELAVGRLLARLTAAELEKARFNRRVLGYTPRTGVGMIGEWIERQPARTGNVLSAVRGG
jgi:hypothetical protein